VSNTGYNLAILTFLDHINREGATGHETGGLGRYHSCIQLAFFRSGCPFVKIWDDKKLTEYHMCSESNLKTTWISSPFTHAPQGPRFNV